MKFGVAMTTKNFKTLFTWNTLYNADSVEWCPLPPYQNYFACGTYELVEGNKKKGTISLFSVGKQELKENSRMETPAVLDMKWSSIEISNKIILGVANSDGEICLFFITDGELRFLTKCNLNGTKEDVLILSLDWSKQPYSDLICCSDSKGRIILLKFTGLEVIVLNEWKAHSLEAWITCFDSFNSHVIYTGGDDAEVNVWDSRTEPTKIARCTKHTAGVTVLNCRPGTQSCLASGSYDETICVWDTRNWKAPSHDMSASGGLWRLKWKPEVGSHTILAACIYGGFDIINPFALSTIARYREHESLAYGADWCHLKESDFFCNDQYLIATCSFYDRKLCVSLWDENKNIVDG